ncbi:MAG: hypothetical protein U5N53_09025 [Mycobacterium sp.]|nr:hypothetical protein [Mycobacterium sp.]
MTPSAAHDSAWQRGADHDEMGIAVRDYVRANFKRFEGEALDTVQCERLFSPNKGSQFFGDVVAEYQGGSVRVFEIKPKIYSAGALAARSPSSANVWSRSTSGHGRGPLRSGRSCWKATR